MYVFIWKDKSSGLAFPYLKLDDIISLTSYLQICLKDQKANVTQLMHFRNLIASTLIYFFSTVDRDNDAWSKNCAERFSGAWWYSACHNSNLNGLYLRGEHESFGDGVNWYHWKGYHYSLKLTVLKIRGVRPKRRRRSPSDRL